MQLPKLNTIGCVFKVVAAADIPMLRAIRKSLPLMETLVQVYPAGTILDPFAGSGTIGVVALRAGRRFIGCEREEAYYAITSERLSKAA
ncbi:DNA methyltransferase [Roseibium sp. HPY-6]|uniref:DNA methyltransferase n=1 Tax=Roseibium sp. HPY-6 TaxID=3229852 RepID=UPI00338F07A6